MAITVLSFGNMCFIFAIDVIPQTSYEPSGLKVKALVFRFLSQVRLSLSPSLGIDWSLKTDDGINEQAGR